MSAELVCAGSLEALDQELVRLTHGSGALRFWLGTGLEALARIAGHHELGFATLEGYALERCERSARWVQESCWLARRLRELPEVRRALLEGSISFSVAQCIAKVACAENERTWLDEAQGRTLREMRALAKQRAQEAAEFRKSEAQPRVADCEAFANCEEELATLTVTVDREDAWLFECVRMILARIAGASAGETIEALLGEGTTTLFSNLSREQVMPFDDMEEDLAQRQWEAQLSRWREEAEARSEASLRASAIRGSHGRRQGADLKCTDQEFQEFQALQGDATAIDARLRLLAADLAKRDLAVGQLAEAFWNADGWRRLGYATAAQYARERLGMSLSSVKAKRALARRAERLPPLATAVANGTLGYEAARLISQVASAETVEQWVERAAERTLRHLREEVDAAQMFARLAPGEVASPPSDAIMLELAALESRVVTGAVFKQRVAGQMSAGRREPSKASQRRASTRARGLGRVTLHFRVPLATRRYYRWLERLFLRHRPARVHFLRFLCCALVEAWQHTLGSAAEYAAAYGRDRYRCVSPVCGRRGVTPHHLKFRSAGGDDSLENIASLCVWCHLEGIHGGRLCAAPPASHIDWAIGRNPHTVVRGRRRLAA